MEVHSPAPVDEPNGEKVIDDKVSPPCVENSAIMEETSMPVDAIGIEGRSPVNPRGESSPSRKGSGLPTSQTIYIGNLSQQYANETILEKLLQKYGRIQRISVHHRDTIGSTGGGRGRGTAAVAGGGRGNGPRITCFAFAQFASSHQAMAAIESLHGRKLAGRPLVVRPANDSSKRESSSSVSMGSLGVSNGNQNDSINNDNKPLNPTLQRSRIESRIQAIQDKLLQHGTKK